MVLGASLISLTDVVLDECLALVCIHNFGRGNVISLVWSTVKEAQVDPGSFPYGLSNSVKLNFPSKHTGEGCHFLFQVIFLTLGLVPSL